MFAEKHLQTWWSARSDEQRACLKQAAQQSKLDPDTVKLLFDTGCPVGPVGTEWETQPDWDWSWPRDVRTFITQQQSATDFSRLRGGSGPTWVRR